MVWDWWGVTYFDYCLSPQYANYRKSLSDISLRYFSSYFFRLLSLFFLFSDPGFAMDCSLGKLGQKSGRRRYPFSF